MSLAALVRIRIRAKLVPRSIEAVSRGSLDNKGDRDVRACLPAAIIKSLIDRTEGKHKRQLFQMFSNDFQTKFKAAHPRKANWFAPDKERFYGMGLVWGSFLMFRTILIIAALAQPGFKNVGSANLNQHLELKAFARSNQRNMFY